MTIPTPITTAIPPGFTVAVVATDERTGQRLADAVEAQGLPVVQRAASVEELSASLNGRRPTWALVACNVRGPTSRAAIRSLGDRLEKGVIVVLGDASPRDVSKALRARAVGVLIETEVEQSLGVALAALAAGLVVLPADARSHVARRPLSNREKQILAMLVMGFTNLEIANRLYLAESTVKSHVSSAFDKLGVRSRTEASALILDPEEGLGVGILALTTDPGNDVPGQFAPRPSG